MGKHQPAWLAVKLKAALCMLVTFASLCHHMTCDSQEFPVLYMYGLAQILTHPYRSLALTNSIDCSNRSQHRRQLANPGLLISQSSAPVQSRPGL